MERLLDLPTETLIVLGAGYLAYRTAYDGLRSGHKALDVTFISIAFGLVAKLVLLALKDYSINQFVSAGIAIASALVLAAAWRTWLRRWWEWLLRRSHVSYSDGMITAWDKVRTDTKTYVTRLSVRKTNGDILLCDALQDFQDQPFGPCQFGQDGSVSIYVTALKRSGDKKYTEKIPKMPDAFWGSKLTYIPAEQIAEIDLWSSKR